MNTKMITFIKKEIASYVEPIRQGIAKGELIGLSSIKYKSALLFLTNLKGKEIAEAVSVSYGILRVWRTESSYLQVIDRHKETFARNVIKSLCEVVEGTKKEGPGDEINYCYGKEINDQLAKDFADIPIYADDLMVEIYKQARTAQFENLNAERTFLSFLGFIFALRKGFSFPTTDKAIADSPIMKRDQPGVFFFNFIEALQKPWTPNKEKAENVKSSFLKKL
jgi:hypothetical protein